MPTPAERKALLFLAGVIVLGASVRVVRAARHDRSPDDAGRQALARQLAAVDSAKGNESRSSRPRVGKSQSLPRRSARRWGRGRRAVDSIAASDSAQRWVREPLSESTGYTNRDTSTKPLLPMDLDVATEVDIESLPRIGPVLAKRIVDDRTARGPFGSIEGLERVRGVGPSLAASLRGRVTFSGTARPSNAVVESRLRSIPTSSKSHRRERKN